MYHRCVINFIVLLSLISGTPHLYALEKPSKLDHKVEKLARPIETLSLVLDRRYMAFSACRFLAGLNNIFSTNYGIDDGLYSLSIVMQIRGRQLDADKICYIHRLLKDASKCPQFSCEVNEMSNEEVRGYIFLFCGSLLAITSHPKAVDLGNNLIGLGMNEITLRGYDGMEQY